MKEKIMMSNSGTELLKKIEVWELDFSYGNHKVLKNINFSVPEGTFVSLLGPNGVGKSTLFRCMLGLLKPEKGAAFIDGSDICLETPRELAKKIAYIPQSHNPVFNYSVLDMVLMGTTAQLGKFSSPGPEQKEEAGKALEKLGIVHLKDRGYRTISGGERQMVLAARALSQKARILIMDEPSASLDFGNRVRVMKTMRNLADSGYTVIQSTHDPDQAYLYSDKILVLHEGTVLAYGAPSEVMTEELISKIYGVDVEIGTLQDGRVRVCVPR